MRGIAGQGRGCRWSQAQLAPHLVHARCCVAPAAIHNNRELRVFILDTQTGKIVTSTKLPEPQVRMHGRPKPFIRGRRPGCTPSGVDCSSQAMGRRRRAPLAAGTKRTPPALACSLPAACSAPLPFPGRHGRAPSTSLPPRRSTGSTSGRWTPSRRAACCWPLCLQCMRAAVMRRSQVIHLS